MIETRSRSICTNICASMDQEAVVNAEKSKIAVSDEIPIIIERPNCALSTTNDYINLLLKNYESQIQYLKDELRRKDDIINDLFDIKQTRDSKSCLCSADSNQSYDTNVDISVGNEKHSNDYKWQYPRRNAKNVVLQSELAPLPTSNRYIDLQLNEWTKWKLVELARIFARKTHRDRQGNDEETSEELR